jgi:hypothetical protein
MNVIFLFIFYLLIWYFGIFNIDYIICTKIIIFKTDFFKKKNCEGKLVIWNVLFLHENLKTQ